MKMKMKISIVHLNSPPQMEHFQRQFFFYFWKKIFGQANGPKIDH